MIIQSKFKDYYDHISHINGGDDPSIHYHRTRLAPLKESGFSADNIPLEIDLARLPSYYINDAVVIFKWLIICGKYYLLVASRDTLLPTKWELYNEEKHIDIIKKNCLRYRYIKNYEEQTLLGEFSHDLLDVSRQVNAPVFCVVQYSSFSVETEIPVLSNIVGFPAFYPAEQIYQDISYFLGNTIKLSPDTSPVPAITNKEKILQHGFDLKQSFRHRK